jgi:hypothetical protein
MYQQILCKDCGKDTGRRGLNEYYMVSREIWTTIHQAFEEKTGFLCIGCLEKRLGRTLVREDFPDCPENMWLLIKTQSYRLKIRFFNSAVIR